MAERFEILDTGTANASSNGRHGVTHSVAFLRNVPVLAGLSDELLERLAGEVEEVQVRAGDWILREGETADSLFIVRSGRVEVIDEGPPEALIRVLRRGDVLGELALLREGTRSASARARRDTELLELGRAPFEALIQEAPELRARSHARDGRAARGQPHARRGGHAAADDRRGRPRRGVRRRRRWPSSWPTR